MVLGWPASQPGIDAAEVGYIAFPVLTPSYTLLPGRRQTRQTALSSTSSSFAAPSPANGHAEESVLIEGFLSLLPFVLFSFFWFFVAASRPRGLSEHYPHIPQSHRDRTPDCYTVHPNGRRVDVGLQAAARLQFHVPSTSILRPAPHKPHPSTSLTGAWGSHRSLQRSPTTPIPSPWACFIWRRTAIFGPPVRNAFCRRSSVSARSELGHCQPDCD